MNGAQLLEIRCLLGMSQSEFASELGLSRTFISLMEGDAKPICRRTELSALYLKSQAVNLVNNASSVNNDCYRELTDLFARLLVRRLVTTNQYITSQSVSSKSKDVRRAYKQVSDLLQSLNREDIDRLRAHYANSADDHSLKFIDAIVEQHLQHFGSL